LAGWLRRQADRPGPLGDAAGLTVAAVHRSAGIVSEISGEVARATSSEPVPGAPVKRRGPRRKPAPKSPATRRTRPAG